MKVILIEDVDRVGRKGDIRNVANGYGRNFLLPRKLAVVATEGNLKQVEQLKKREKVREAKEETDALQMKEQLEQVSLTIAMKAGEGDVLFGSVTSSDISEALEKEGYSIDKRKVELDEPIKRLGVFDVSVKLFRNVNASVKIWVVKE